MVAVFLFRGRFVARIVWRPECCFSSWYANNECVGKSPLEVRTGCFEATGIALPFLAGSIDSAIGLFYSDFMALMTPSRPRT